MTITLLLGVFFSSLVSGWHCALMCGGIASKTAEQIVQFRSPSKMLLDYLILHAARITMYGLLGAIAGQVGALVWWQEILPIQRGLFFFASLLLLWKAKQVLRPQTNTGLRRVWLVRIEKRVAGLWASFTQLFQWPQAPVYLQRISFGLAWGLVPCGLVYSVLSLAFLSGSSFYGGLLMVAMGLGTLPNLLLFTGGFGRLNAYLAQLGLSRYAKYLAAMLLIISALFGIYQAFTLPIQFLKNGICFN